jgi:hypothetical protein
MPLYLYLPSRMIPIRKRAIISPLFAISNFVGSTASILALAKDTIWNRWYKMLYDFGNGPVPAHRHPNGGGIVADTASVSDTAYVGPDARVYDYAWVFDNAEVCGDARVYGNAQVYNFAWVYGYAQVYGNTRIYDNARVYSGAQVYDDAWVYGNAWVYGYAQVYGNALVYGDAQVYGRTWVYDNAQVYGDALVYSNTWVYGYVRVTSPDLHEDLVVGDRIRSKSNGTIYVVSKVPPRPRVIRENGRCWETLLLKDLWERVP